MRPVYPPVVMALLCASSIATASPGSMRVNANGTVTVDGITYSSMKAYYTSADFRQSGRRCGTPMPASQAVELLAPQDCSLSSTTIQPEYEPESGQTFNITVVFHVIESSNGDGHIADDLLHSQIDILNEDYNAEAGTPGEPGTNAKIHFALAEFDPDGNPTDGIDRVVDNAAYQDPYNHKPQYAWDTTRYLNLYTGNPSGGILGIATFPQEDAGDDVDGVVLLADAVGRDSPAAPYDQGRTATHEIGHYLGLYHTFQDGCAGNTYTTADLITDTVAEAVEQYECTEAPSDCGGGNNPIHNYMDYTNDTCMTGFTAEQVNRMRCAITNYRTSLINLVPKAAFEHADDVMTIDFTDKSADDDGSIASWEWDFGDGATSTEQNPSHTYDDFGLYTVMLTVTDDQGGKASFSEDVAANILPEAKIAVDQNDLETKFRDESSDENGSVVAWSWDFGDGETSTEQNPTHTYAMAGTYTVTLLVTDDLGGTATATEEIQVDDGGCFCSAGGSGVPPLGEALLFGLALVSLRRRRRRA